MSSLRSTISCSGIDYEKEKTIEIGDSEGKCSCKDSESGIADTTGYKENMLRYVIAKYAYRRGFLRGECQISLWLKIRSHRGL